MSDQLYHDAFAELEELYKQVGEEAQRIFRYHAHQLKCGYGCSDCCQDDLSVLQVEADHIRRKHAKLLASEKPRAPGRCAFLSEAGACRIYPSRPYVCQTQGLPLRWIEETIAGDLLERRGICHLNVLQPALSDVAEDCCFLIGPHEDRLAALQQRYAGSLTRVPLRSLFRVVPQASADATDVASRSSKSST